MIYEQLKAYIQSNFILLVTFLGLMLLFSGNSAEVIGKKKTGLFRLLALVVFLLSILDFFKQNDVLSNPVVKQVCVWADYLSLPIAIGYVAAVIHVMMKNGAYAGVVWERKAVIFSAYVVIIATAYSMFTGGFGVLNPTILISLLFFCFFLHALALKTQVKEAEKALHLQKNAILEQEMEPRFILDTVEIIKIRTETDPKGARETLSALSNYMEDNLDTSDFGKPVSFANELKRTRNYLNIIRAGLPGINVEYRIETVEFRIPKRALLQTVENSISAGFAGREKGNIIIKAFASEFGHTVIVQDDGRGLPGRRDNTDALRERLAALCDGELTVMAEPGFGTTVMISIPNKKK